MRRDRSRDSKTIVTGISRGIEDMRTGRLVPHKQAMRRLRKTIARARKRGARSTN